MRQPACPKKSLSIFFYSKQFRVQQLGYEMNDRTSLQGINSLSLSLSLFLKPWKSRKLLVIIDFGKVKVDRLVTYPSFGQVMIFNYSFYVIILYFWQVRYLITPEFHNKKYTKEALGFCNVNCLFPLSLKFQLKFGRVKPVF